MEKISPTTPSPIPTGIPVNIIKIILKNNIETIEFKVHSRLDKLDSRGCGDTLPDHYYI